MNERGLSISESWVSILFSFQLELESGGLQRSTILSDLTLVLAGFAVAPGATENYPIMRSGTAVPVVISFSVDSSTAFTCSVLAVPAIVQPGFDAIAPTMSLVAGGVGIVFSFRPHQSAIAFDNFIAVD